jgi:hypothetical protein
MIKPKKMWREKHLTWEEHDTEVEDGTKVEEVVDVGSTLDINMLFVLPEEFSAPDNAVAQLCAGAKCAVLENRPRQASTWSRFTLRGIWMARQWAR